MILYYLLLVVYFLLHILYYVLQARYLVHGFGVLVFDDIKLVGAYLAQRRPAWGIILVFCY